MMPRGELAEAFEELKKVEILDDRERSSERAAAGAREQATARRKSHCHARRAAEQRCASMTPASSGVT